MVFALVSSATLIVVLSILKCLSLFEMVDRKFILICKEFAGGGSRYGTFKHVNKIFPRKVVSHGVCCLNCNRHLVEDQVTCYHGEQVR